MHPLTPPPTPKAPSPPPPQQMQRIATRARCLAVRESRLRYRNAEREKGFRQHRWNSSLSMSSMATSASGQVHIEKKHAVPIPGPLLHTVSLRCKDLRETQLFYHACFGMRMLHYVTANFAGFTCMYIGSRTKLRFPSVRENAQKKSPSQKQRDDAERIQREKEGIDVTQPGNMDAHDYIYHTTDTLIEFIQLHDEAHNHRFKIGTGNEQDSLGFGGITIMVDNLDQTCRNLHLHKAKIIAEPTEEDPSVLCLDPSGYHIRIVERKPSLLYMDLPKHQQYEVYTNAARLRVRDPKVAVPFYKMFFNMIVLCEREFPKLNLTRYWLCSKEHLKLTAGFVPLPDPRSDEAWEMTRLLRTGFVELQHHHGTEDHPDFTYHSGNTTPLGFAHLGFLVKDVNEIVAKCVEYGIYVLKNVGEGALPQTAWIMDPDGYWIELSPSRMKDIIIREDTEDARQQQRIV